MTNSILAVLGTYKHPLKMSELLQEVVPPTNVGSLLQAIQEFKQEMTNLRDRQVIKIYQGEDGLMEVKLNYELDQEERIVTVVVKGEEIFEEMTAKYYVMKVEGAIALVPVAALVDMEYENPLIELIVDDLLQGDYDYVLLRLES